MSGARNHHGVLRPVACRFLRVRPAQVERHGVHRRLVFDRQQRPMGLHCRQDETQGTYGILGDLYSLGVDSASFAPNYPR